MNKAIITLVILTLLLSGTFTFLYFKYQKPVTEPVPEKTIYELLKEKTLEAFSLGIKPKVIQLYEEFGIKVLTELKNEQYADYLEKIKKLVAEETVFK
jgi:hypothetical protein